MKTFGVIILVLGCLMIGPSVLLQRRAGHLLAPRPIVLVWASAGMMILGALFILIIGGAQ
jgi:hypothetical protein